MQRARRVSRGGPWHDAGALFAWGALAAAVVAQLAGGMVPVILGLALFAAGLAHGAGDEQAGAIRPFGPVHAAAYVAVGLAVAGLFLTVPLAGLLLFLALSAWHFARSDCAFAREARWATAALATGGSALFRPGETAQVFAAVLGDAPPEPFMLPLAVVGAGGIAAALYALATNRRGCGEAVLALGATALLHPVLAVGLVFLVGHAIPIQRRQLARYGADAVWRAVALPTLIALVGTGVLALASVSGGLPLTVAAALAFGLATPHMLTERLER